MSRTSLKAPHALVMPEIEWRGMMKKGDHLMRSPSRGKARLSFEKTIHNTCPNCGSTDLAVYFKSRSPRKIGAYCYSCGLVGFFARNDFFELGRITPPQFQTRPFRNWPAVNTRTFVARINPPEKQEPPTPQLNRKQHTCQYTSTHIRIDKVPRHVSN